VRKCVAAGMSQNAERLHDEVFLGIIPRKRLGHFDAQSNPSSVKNSQVLDLESRNGALWKSSLPGNCFAEGDSLQI
jgi:hypothetical protein